MMWRNDGELKGAEEEFRDVVLGGIFLLWFLLIVLILKIG
jgi:hypothetical protein